MATLGDLQILDVRIKYEGKVYKIPISEDDAWVDDGGDLTISLIWRELFFRMASNIVEEPNPPEYIENAQNNN